MLEDIRGGLRRRARRDKGEGYLDGAKFNGRSFNQVAARLCRLKVNSWLEFEF